MIIEELVLAIKRLGCV